MLEKPFWHLVINNAIVLCKKPLPHATNSTSFHILPRQGLIQQSCSPGSGSRNWAGQLENELIFVQLHRARQRRPLAQSGHREHFTGHKDCEGSLPISPTSSSAAQAEEQSLALGCELLFGCVAQWSSGPVYCLFSLLLTDVWGGLFCWFHTW